MPIYPFECQICGKVIDLHLSIVDYEKAVIKDEDKNSMLLSDCPQCGQEALFMRVICSFSILGSTDHTKFLKRSEDRVVLDMEKATAFKEGGQKGLRDWRLRNRHKFTTKEGRKKSWEEQLLG